MEMADGGSRLGPTTRAADTHSVKIVSAQGLYGKAISPAQVDEVIRAFVCSFAG